MKLKVSELFYSAQGEGRFIGVPSVFLRTFGCNFTCAGFGCKPGKKSTEADDVAKSVHLYKTFEELPLVNTGCDSYASWHPDFKELSPTYEIDTLVDKMLDLIPDRKWTNRTGNDTHLVIPGGEPWLGWQRTYQDLFDHDHMRSIKNVTFETNGTQKLQPKFKTYLNEWLAGQNELTFSVSPKLSTSGELWDEAIKPEIVAEYQEVGTVYLKFVIDSEIHFEEVDRAVADYRAAGFKGVVYVMPQGGVVAPYAENRVNVADWALVRGYYYTPRLHVDLWGNGWGK